ncbi:MAG: sodium:proton antiporter [Ardenticatenaceae bacterium]|nr:sodium:proton antiporter [Ardenticatenaceae bacterium]
MHQNIVIGIGSILILGILSQWIGWRLKLPAILPLLIVGFIAGPVTGFLHPDEVIGELLFPVVSISVAVILFEGGLSLKQEEMVGVSKVVIRLISIGVLVTWLGAGLAAYFVFGLSLSLSALLGAILVVSGPTVVLPMLRSIRPVNRVRTILKWEGILVDPVGATLAVLVLGVIVTGDPDHLTIPAILLGIGLTLLVGGLIGGAIALFMIVLFRREWVPEYLQTAFTLMLVIGAFLISNSLRAESGLMAVTVMGIVFANQKQVNIQHIVSFKEELGILLLSVLFIVLSARMRLSDFAGIGWEALIFLALLIVVIRPLATWISTIRSRLPWQERLFMAWMAPRGIVAAAVASLFALELRDLGYAGTEKLVALTFLVVVGTVTVYALTAGPLAHLLGVIQTNPQGTLIVGAHGWAREIASAIEAAGFEVWLVDTNLSNVRAAELEGLTAVHGNILTDDVLDSLPLARIGRLLALTSNSELNALAGLSFQEYLGRDNIYMLASATDGLSDVKAQLLREHCLFDVEKGFDYLEQQFDAGATVQVVPISEQFTFPDFKAKYGDTATPLFISDEQTLDVVLTKTAVNPKVGQRLISVLPANGWAM